MWWTESNIHALVLFIKLVLKKQASHFNAFFPTKKEGKDQESIQSSTTPDPDTNGRVAASQLDITNESQEVSPFPAGYNKASINRQSKVNKVNKTWAFM